VVGRHGKRFPEFRAPILGRLLLPGIDQVETHPGKGPSGDIEGVARFGHTVQPAEPPQIGVVQGLDTHGDTIDACLPKRFEPVGLDGGRVRLEGYLHIVGEGPRRPRGVEDGADDLGLHERRCSAAEEDAAQDARARFPGNASDFR
jgi:hypothetical protein